MKKQETNHNKILFFLLPLTAFALYILHIASSADNSEGDFFIAYTNSYPFLLLGEYLLCTFLLFPFIIKADKKNELNAYILPLMLFSSLGMMRIDSPVTITGDKADHAPAIMFLILFATLIIMAFSGFSVLGTVGIITGTLLFPAFGICFSPFIAAASFLLVDSNKAEKKVSVILNTLLSITAAVFSAIRLPIQDFAFDKKYIPVLIASAVTIIFLILKKDFTLIPLGFLPLFPVAADIFFNVFPTSSFALAASIAAFTITLGAAALKGSKKIQGYALSLVHNPAYYIIVSVFILHTASSYFVNPGYLRDIYK